MNLHSSTSSRLRSKNHKPRAKGSRPAKVVIQLLSAIVLIVVGCGLLITGFIVPPPGEIHNSVLIAFGEILTFAGALFGIDYHYKYKSQNHEDN